MELDDPAVHSPKPGLKGLRLRWASHVTAACDSGEPSEPLSEDAVEPCENFQDDFGSLDANSDVALDEWTHIPFEQQTEHSDMYEPESPVDGAVESDSRPLVVDPNGTEAAWQHCALSASSKRQRLDRDKLPWEQASFTQIFRTGDRWQGTAVSSLDVMLQPTSLGIRDVLHSEVVSEHSGHPVAEVAAPPVIPINLRKVRRELPDEDIRRVALCKLKDLILHDPLASQLGVSINNMLNGGCSPELIHQSISDCFRMKASSTLQKRSSSLWRLSKLLRYKGVSNPLRLTEEQLYAALCALRESGAGATSAQHMVEALHFLDSTAKLVLVDLRAVISGRCKGVARDMFLMKNPLEQKHPLSLECVQHLESLFQSLPNSMKCILGQFLFCIHACCRWKDSQRVKCLWTEQGHGEVLVHADALASKTALSAEARNRYLPYIALGSGVTGLDWGTEWITARLVEGLEYQEYILPSFSERALQWTDSPMSASEATYWLREFLGESVPAGCAFHFGSHSCKTTLLTWAGRCVQVQFSPVERRLLGHHLEPNMKSILTYSRESYTTLYSTVLTMFRLMRDGAYNPDMSAIDRVVQLSDFPEHVASDQQGQADQIEADVEFISDSESSVASDCGEAGEEQFWPGADERSVTTSLFPDFPGVPEGSLYVHKVSGLVHAANEDDYLLCGRKLSLNFKPYSQMQSDRQICDGCSQCKKAFHQ
eukprot:s171_g29.t1